MEDTLQHSNTENPLSYTLLCITMLGAWYHNLSKDDVTFYITLVSGLAATVSFIVKAAKDFCEMRQNRKNNKKP